MKNFLKKHWVDIMCVAGAVVMTVMLVLTDTDLSEEVGNGWSTVFYGVLFANMFSLPALTWHHYDD